jgi:hypothetical protein
MSTRPAATGLPAGTNSGCELVSLMIPGGQISFTMGRVPPQALDGSGAPTAQVTARRAELVFDRRVVTVNWGTLSRSKERPAS